MDFGRNDYNDFIHRGIFHDERDRVEIESNEPVFLIRGSDPIATELLMTYATKLMSSGSDKRIVDSVVNHAERFRKYQKEHGTKGADLMRDDSATVADRMRINEILNSIEIGAVNDDKLEELHKLMEDIYGPKSICVLLPGDLDKADTPLGFRCNEIRKKEFDASMISYAYANNGVVLMKRSVEI